MKPKKLTLCVAGLCLLVAATVFVFQPPKVDALPGSEFEIIFLDANGNQVGNKFRDCNGNGYMEGIRTNIKVIYAESCQTSFGIADCYNNGQQVSCSQPPVPFYDACVANWGTALCSNN